MSNTHFIQKQNIELVIRSGETAENQWEGFLNLHKNEGHEAMSVLFDRIAPEKKWIRIDRLEIDLGIIPESSLRISYADILQSALEKALGAWTGIEEKKNVLLADAVSVWESNIIHYLEHGFFLWETVVPGFSKSNEEILQSSRDIIEKKILELLDGRTGFRRSLYYKLVQTPVAMQRWLRQFSLSFHSRVKELLIIRTTGSLSSFIDTALKLIEKVVSFSRLSTINPEYEKAHSVIWKISFSGTGQEAVQYLKEWINDQQFNEQQKRSLLILLEKGNETSTKKVLDYLFENPVLITNSADKEVSLTMQFDKLLVSLFVEAGIAADKNTDTEYSWQGLVNEIKKKVTKPGEEDAVGLDKTKDQENNSPEPLNTRKEAEKKKLDELTEEIAISPGETIYINNAGIVLLGPFIENFFSNAGLDTANKLQDDLDASLGVQLLQLLSGGEWNEGEHLLSLNKILCGRNPAWPACHIKDIPVNAATECIDLLQNVTRYWDALKNTSPEALQETFLQRQGKLLFKDEAWRLWVEYKTSDILLQQIPWAFSVVKFPWMQYPLYIEW